MQQIRTFFVALPDNESASSVAALLAGVANVTLTHPSGRPWLLARVASGDLVEHSAGPRRLALVGSTAATPSDLERIATKIRVPQDFTAVSRQIAGSYCVVGSLDGLVYASGPAMETRRIFHAVVNGVRVVADRADVLAELGGFAVDDVALSLRLVSALPHPCNDVAMWREVTPVPGADYVTVDHDGRGLNRATWWRRPDAAISRGEGADKLRDAVESAVRARTATGTAVACDLSGGLDSTPLCYFAAQGPHGVLARTLYNNDPGGREDLKWAQRALESMPGVHAHLVSSTDEMADFYGGLLDMRVQLDEPTQAATAGPRIQQMLADDVDRGVRTHINGLGGDHLLRGVKGWHHSLMRTRPLQAWRRARAEDVPDGIAPLTTLRRLLDRRSYCHWFTDAVSDAVNGVKRPDGLRIDDWAPPLSIPPWLSADARAAVVCELREVSATAEPHDAELAAHFDIASLRDAGRLVRGTGQLGQPVGVAYEAPLLDDHVVEAALAVRREERDSPLEWKPMMKAAMRGLLPDDYLRRTTKVGGAPQSARGYAAHFDDIVAICEGSGLADIGLIDMDRFSSEAKPDAKAIPSNRVHETINAAVFLRNLGSRTGAMT
ncbi:asparagine synthase-related protein [Saccharopolyspora sp. K220]|uniref:asparagine synthase-related protein n=1 Tax=Saccharopolyspora soli TaxID=2926618 RepID=UPI001F57E9CB|nr:asparagine synthase-related protein [Saccharopolyspora soli]MCI2423728.1 asparagine synthase-related protein [Saccharopolyspora soli]